MGWITTGRVVATVTDIHALGNWTEGNSPNITMGQDLMALLGSEMTIVELPMRMICRQPRPAGRCSPRSVHLRPEPIFGGNLSAISGTRRRTVFTMPLSDFMWLYWKWATTELANEPKPFLLSFIGARTRTESSAAFDLRGIKLKRNATNLASNFYHRTTSAVVSPHVRIRQSVRSSRRFIRVAIPN